MKRFLVVQHSYSEFLGTIEKELETRDIGFAYQRPFTGQALPASALQFDALWLLGGAYPVTDRDAMPWIDDELRLVAAFRRAQRPVVGLGHGAHVVAVAVGGAAHGEPLHDAYWTTARATTAGRDDPVAQAVDGRRVLVMANGRVALPAGTEPLATDEAGRWISRGRMRLPTGCCSARSSSPACVVMEDPARMANLVADPEVAFLFRRWHNDASSILDELRKERSARLDSHGDGACDGNTARFVCGPNSIVDIAFRAEG